MDFAGNDYPNQDNFPSPSFQRAVPLPSVAPDDEPTTLVEYNFAWVEYLMGAVSQLLLYSTWEGTDDEKTEAVNQAAILKDLLQLPVDVDRRIQTPFWDEDTTVDDTEERDEQEWYGQVEDAFAPADELTFVEDATIWLLTGFVAVASAPTLGGAAAAAIFFRTTAKRFILAFHRGDIKEQIRVIIDGADYGMVETGAVEPGGLIELSVDGLADTPDHDIYLVAKVAE